MGTCASAILSVRFACPCWFRGLLPVSLLLSCQGRDAAPPPLPVAANSSSAAPPILTKNRRFTYAVRWYAPDGTLTARDTVQLTALGVPWIDPDSLQTACEWQYTPDSTLTSTPRQTTGAIENGQGLSLHPPRYDRYRILELNPFPDIHRPAAPGTTWEGVVYPPDYYADSAWALWQGSITVRQQYRLLADTLLRTPLGTLQCTPVQATGTSELGTTHLRSYFHPAYGFVGLRYGNINRSRVELDLVAVDRRPESAQQLRAMMVDQVFLPSPR